jgi:hypothetical protein
LKGYLPGCMPLFAMTPGRPYFPGIRFASEIASITAGSVAGEGGSMRGPPTEPPNPRVLLLLNRRAADPWKALALPQASVNRESPLVRVAQMDLGHRRWLDQAKVGRRERGAWERPTADGTTPPHSARLSTCLT